MKVDASSMVLVAVMGHETGTQQQTSQLLHLINEGKVSYH